MKKKFTLNDVAKVLEEINNDLAGKGRCLWMETNENKYISVEGYGPLSFIKLQDIKDEVDLLAMIWRGLDNHMKAIRKTMKVVKEMYEKN